MKFKTKSGWLTDYALSCGYKETTYYLDKDEKETSISVELYKQHNVHHVRTTNGDWESFSSLILARNCFKELTVKYNLIRNIP